MVSFASENMVCINGDDFMNESVLDVLQLNNNVFLMSLVEESLVEEYNNEELDSIIRSLEAEINQKSMEDQDSVMEPPRLLICSDVELMDGDNCPDSLNLDHDFAWDDRELAASSKSDDLNFYLDSYEMDCTVEFGGVSDHSQPYHGIFLENHGCYSSVWNGTQDSVICL